VQVSLHKLYNVMYTVGLYSQRCQIGLILRCGPDTFIIMQSRVDAYKFSLFQRTVTHWNSLPSSVRSKPSIDSFKTAISLALLLVINEP